MVLATTVTQATSYTFNFSGGAIPDGNPAGISFTTPDLGTLNGGPGIGFGTDIIIQDVNVRLDIAGGYNGDLYSYLVHSSGFSVLLDRVGTGLGSEPQFTYGFSTSGFGSITLDQSAGASIHTVENPAGGTYRPDSGTLNSGGLNAFNGLNPNGTWTLFLADLGNGETSTLVSWSLDIEAVPPVPEPTTLTLMGVGMIFWGARRMRVMRDRRQ